MNAGVRAPRNLPPLYEVFQGNIHLGDEVYIAEQKMRHLMKLPSDRRFTKDVMRCLWTAEQLQERSVTGQVSRRLVRSGGVAKQALTPRKVAAVKNALQYYIMHHRNPDTPEEADDVSNRLACLNNIMTNFLSDLGRPSRRVTL
ncbi:uncharacterized protein LOC121837432 [Ixodes scapularis]|nr:uncharacterized protein LOC121837432 [Ixodes scapularis]